MGYKYFWTFCGCLLVLLFSPFIQANQNSIDAVISTTAESIVLVGSTVQLDGTNSTMPPNDEIFYSWSFAEMPLGSESYFSTPSPSMPSFIVDREGLYVIRLVVGSRDTLSDPEYLIVSAVASSGITVLNREEFSTPLLCTLTLGFLGCTEEPKTFTATPGNYSLNVFNRSSNSISITLNSETVISYSFVGNSEILSVPIILLEENNIGITMSGGLSSAVDVEIVESTLPVDTNSAPTVLEIRSTTGSNNMTSKTIRVSDIDPGQIHISKVLNSSPNALVLISNNIFHYIGLGGFTGKDKFDILTIDDGRPVKGVISKVIINSERNTRPILPSRQVVLVPIDSTTFNFNLIRAMDAEQDSIDYSLTEQPDEGDLSCSNVNDVFDCDYVLPEDFRKSFFFSYQANDGVLNSFESQVVLRSFRPNSTIIALEAGANHSCALFNQGNIRCWGRNNSGELGYGHRSNIGDDETPLSEGDVSVGEEIVKVSLGSDFTCALLKTGQVKCWGSNNYSNLGSVVSSSFSYNQEAFSHKVIDFGTSMKVVDIDSGHRHSCALFESGQVKCWGLNSSGQLGLGHTTSSTGYLPSRLDFVDIGGIATAISLGNNSSCAALGNGNIKCWGSNTHGQLAQGNTGAIGDDELPSSISAISLGGHVVELSSGYDFHCARISNGDIKCWGYNRNGELGLNHNNTVGDDESPQDPVSLGMRAVKVASGRSSSCALLEDNNIKCWGSNSYGQIGETSLETISLAEPVIDIAVGSGYSCVVLLSGKVNCWGYNRNGELGIASSTNTTDTSISTTLGEALSSLHPRFSFSQQRPITSRLVSFNASSSFSKGAEIASYAWDFGDGGTGSGVSIEHTFSDAGIYNVQLTVTNSSNKSSSVTKIIKILVPNNPPYFHLPQRVTLEQGKKLELNLDPGIDWEGDSLSYSLVTQPNQGTLRDCLSIATDITCKYEPPENFLGKVSFSYKANDGTLDSGNIAHVEIEVVPEKININQLFSSNNHTCALFENKKISAGEEIIVANLDMEPMAEVAILGTMNLPVLSCLLILEVM